MDWIAITPETVPPTGLRILGRYKAGKSLYYFAGTVIGTKVILDDIGRSHYLEDFTHYAIITEPTV